MARITVVNEYPDFVDLMTSILDEMVGHEVAGFDASEVTLDDLVETRPELLILDCHMADMLIGHGATLDDRTAAALGLLPIVVCSGDVPALRERADVYGDLSNVYALEKPFTLDMLTVVVERALYKAALAPVA
jgi:FixJ family two-component response regulator